MDYEKIIASFFYTGYGIIAHPKNDGRVEVPQLFVRSMQWDECEKLYISYDDGAEFYISDDPKFHSEDPVQIEVAVSNKRVRIPASFLKKICMNNSTLSFMGADALGIVRIDNSHNQDKIEEFISSLVFEDIEELGRLLRGEHVDDGYVVCIENEEAKIPFGEIARAFVKKSPKLILLNKSDSIVFRPTYNPYRFAGNWYGKEIVFSKDKSNTKSSKLYLIPGIQRVSSQNGTFIFGFLLLDGDMFGKVCDIIVHGAGRKTATGVEMIFIHDLYTFGSFKVYENPPEELPEEILIKANSICSDPEGFLTKTFRIVESISNVSNPPLSVNSGTVELRKI